MGLLTENILEQEIVTCGAIYNVENVEAVHTDKLGGLGFGLVPMLIGNPHMQEIKKAIADLPLYSDDKHRLRLDKRALLDFAVACYKWEIQNELRKSNLKVDISSTGEYVHYVITTDYNFDDGWNYDQVMRIRLKKIQPDN